LDFFTLRHCAINHGFGDCISSVIIGCYGYISKEAIW